MVRTTLIRFHHLEADEDIWISDEVPGRICRVTTQAKSAFGEDKSRADLVLSEVIKK